MIEDKRKRNREKSAKYRRSFTGRVLVMWYAMLMRLKRDPSYKNVSLNLNREEFKAFALSSEQYRLCFEKWVLSGFNSRLVPSLDRLNNARGYEIGNIQFLSWEENTSKPRKYLSIGERKEAEKRWDRNKRAKYSPEKRARMRDRARELYWLNRDARCLKTRERRAVKKLLNCQGRN